LAVSRASFDLIGRNEIAPTTAWPPAVVSLADRSQVVAGVVECSTIEIQRPFERLGDKLTLTE